jgi:hypothetical protein
MTVTQEQWNLIKEMRDLKIDSQTIKSTIGTLDPTFTFSENIFLWLLRNQKIQIGMECTTVIECLENCQFGRVKAKKGDLFTVTNSPTEQKEHNYILISRKKNAKMAVGHAINVEDLKTFFKVSSEQ